MVSFKEHPVFTDLVESHGCDRFLNRTSSHCGSFLLKYQLCVCWPCGKTFLLACSQGLNDLDKPSVSDRLGLRKRWRFLRQSQYHTLGTDNKQSLSGARHHVGKRPPLPSCFFFALFQQHSAATGIHTIHQLGTLGWKHGSPVIQNTPSL